MRFILETITGRKGIKNFSSLEEYVDFMTKNGDKIKNIVESDLPYDDKPVSVATPSQSTGWEQVNKATFGDVVKKAEKGDCVLPHKASSVFKDEAKFEPSKSSEKADTSSEPKVDSTPVKNNNEGEEKDLPKFEYKDEEKSEKPETSEKSKPEEEKKEKKEVKESAGDDSEEGFQIWVKDSSQFTECVGTEYSEESAIEEAKRIYDESDDKDIVVFVNDSNTGNTIFSTDSKEQVDEGFGDKIHDLGVKAKQKLGIGLSGKELEDYINEYFVYVFMIANHQIEPNHPSFENITKKLIRTDSKMENVHDVVMSILEDKYYMKGFPADIIEDLLKRRLAKLGIDESIIDKAYDTFVKEEKNKEDESFDDEIAEALRIAGVQLNESNAMEDAIDCVNSAMDDFGGYDDEYLRNVCKDCAEEYGVNFKHLYKAVTNHKWSALDKDEEYDGMDEDVNNPEDGEIDEKSGKEKLFEDGDDEITLEKAKENLAYWKDQLMIVDNGDDFAYSNGKHDRVQRQVDYWNNKVKELSEEPKEDPFAALFAHNAAFMKNHNFEHNVGEKFVNIDTNEVYKIKSVSQDTKTGETEYVLRNEDTYEDVTVYGDELKDEYKPL